MPRGGPKLTLGLLFAAGIVNFLDRSSLAVAGNTIRTELHLTGAEMGWLLSAFSLAYGLAQLPIGSLLDRFGSRSVLGTGLVVWSSAQALTGFTTSLYPFLLLRILLGMGEAPFFPAGIKSIRAWFHPDSRGRATGILNTSTTLGLSLAPPALVYLMLRMGWRGMFLLLGIAGLTVAAAWLLFYRDRSASQDASSPQERIPFTSSFRPKRSAVEKSAIRDASTPFAWHLLRQPTMWGMMLGFGGINYTTWLYLTWLPSYLQAARGISFAHSGWVTAIPFLCGSLGMLVSGTVADRLSQSGTPLIALHRRLILTGMLVSAAATFFVAQAQTNTQAVASTSLALFAIHFAGTSAWGYAQTASPSHLIATVSALQNFGSFVIASIAPVLTGVLLDRTHSFTLALMACTCFTLAGAAVYSTMVRGKIAAA